MLLAALTPLILVCVVVLWCLSDVALWRFGGNDATYSKTILRLEAHSRLIARGLPYTLGVLVGHLENPTTAPDPATWEIIVRLLLACSPFLVTLYRILTGKEATDNDLRTEFGDTSRWVTGLRLVCWFAFGTAVGAVAVPQHI